MTLIAAPKRPVLLALHAARLALTAPLVLTRTPLIRNGYALVTSAALTSALGLAFWMLSARLYTPEHVGLGAALISTLLTLSNIAQLNFGNFLNRFLPVAGARAGSLVLFAYGVGAVTAILISVGFLVAVHPLFAPLSFLADDRWLAAWFVAAVVGWTLFLLQDSAFSGLRQSVWVPLANSSYALIKIGLLIAFAGTVVSGMGLFAAWTLPLLFILTAGNFILFRRILIKQRSSSPSEVNLDRRRMVQYIGWDYLGTLAMMTAMGIAPLAVLKVVGPVANANYHLAWTITYSVYLIARSMGISLLAEGAADRRRLRSLTADALLHTMIPLAGAAVLIAACAPLIMRLFGPVYAKEGTALLRMLALSSIPWGFITIYLALARAQGRMAMVAAVQMATLLLVLGLGILLLGRMGALGMGVAWLITHTTVAIGIVAISLMRYGFGQAGDLLLDLGSSSARVVATLSAQRAQRLSARSELDAAISSLLAEAGEDRAYLRPALHAAPSQSDVTTIFLAERGSASEAALQNEAFRRAEVLVKTAKSPQGMASLERYVDRVQVLRGDPRIKECGFRLPEIISIKRTSESIHLIERVLPGEDGRTTLLRPDLRVPALDAAARTIAYLHGQTAASATIDDQWIAEWIDRPVGLIDRTVSTLMPPPRRQEALAAFRREQREFWRGRVTRLGWGHGDFSPGNIMFATTDEGYGEGDTPPVIAVSGVIDWDRAQPDCPEGLDACHLALTARTLVSGEDFGHTVRYMLTYPRWNSDEQIWLTGPGRPDDAIGGWLHQPDAIRVMVGLAWLGHVAANLEKSCRYAGGRLWTASNVERVLQVFLRARPGARA